MKTQALGAFLRRSQTTRAFAARWICTLLVAAAVHTGRADEYKVRTAPANPPKPVTLSTRPAIPPQKNPRSKPETLWQLLHFKPKATLEEVEPFIAGDPSRSDWADHRDDPLLMVAIRCHREDIARLLIERGANVNWSPANDHDWTPLAQACDRSASLDFVQFLITKGAKLNPNVKEGWTLLHCAAAGGNVDIARFLISKGFSVQVAHHRDGTPLDVAVGAERLEMARFLTEHGGPVNHRDDIGRTPLHRAAKNKDPRLSELLISKGANVNARDKYHRTPLSLAADADNKEVVALLKQHGAQE